VEMCLPRPKAGRDKLPEKSAVKITAVRVI